MRSLGRLLRISLAPSAAADVAAGILLAHGAWPSGCAPGFAIAGSLAAYHGGMALNDWADRESDSRLRPDRPIPSGAIPAPLALSLALLLLVAAPLLGLLAGPLPGALLGLIVLLVLAYDLGPRGPRLGPLLLAACRAANLSLGFSLAEGGTGLGSATCAAALAYGLYVLCVSRLARLEDLPAGTLLGREPARRLFQAAIVLTILPLSALGTRPPVWALALALCLTTAGAAQLFDRARAPGPWKPAQVPPLVGLALRRLLVATAAFALLVPPDGLIVAAAILAGYPFSFALRRLFPPS